MKKIVTSLCGLIAAGMLASAAPARAGDAPDRNGHITFISENDLFWGGTDRHFTNGFRLDWVPKDPWDVFGLGPFMDRFIGGDIDYDPRRYFQLGQNMYTPNDLSRSDVVLDDRPYAGWLYATAGTVRITPGQIDRLELTLGIVGPSSLAGDVHRRWHKWFNFDPPEGWRNQLRDEPGVNLFYERQWRFNTNSTGSGWSAEALPHVNMALGNIYTYAGTGLTLRIGYNVPDDGGPPRIRYGLPGSASVAQAPGNKLGIYAFAGVEGRAVVRNIFIDGNSFRNSHRVNGKTLVGDVTVGFALLFGNRPVRMTYSFTWRSKEFDGQDGADKFGSVSVTLTY